MGTITLSEIETIETVKISELDETTTFGESDVLPGVKAGQTYQVKKSNLVRFLESEYEELSNWLDDVTLGSNGLTTIPQLVLTPSEAALEAIEGGMFYNSVNKAIYVCTDV